MKTREFNKLVKQLKNPKTKLFDEDKMNLLSPEDKERLMFALISHRKPIPRILYGKESYPPSRVACMGYSGEVRNWLGVESITSYDSYVAAYIANEFLDEPYRRKRIQEEPEEPDFDYHDERFNKLFYQIIIQNGNYIKSKPPITENNA